MATASQNPLGLADKTAYGELTDKQAAVVDAVIELGRDASHQEIADEAGVTFAYAQAVRDVHGHIIEDRIGDVPGENGNGEETTEGVPDALEQLEARAEPEVQHISNAPRWSVEEHDAEPDLVIPEPRQMDDPTDDEPDHLSVCVDLSRGEAVNRITEFGAKKLADEYRTAIVNALLDEAGL